MAKQITQDPNQVGTMLHADHRHYLAPKAMQITGGTWLPMAKQITQDPNQVGTMLHVDHRHHLATNGQTDHPGSDHVATAGR